MFNLIANITQRERMVRGFIGAILVLGAFIAPSISIIVGLLLIVSAALNYCGLYELIKKFNLDTTTASTTTTIPPDNKPPL